MKTNVQQTVSLLIFWQKARCGQRRSLPLCIALPAVFLFLFTATSCNHNAGLPKPDSKEYRDLVTAFYVGLAGLQTGEDVRAKEKLTLATQIAPGEPASFANLGLLSVRQQEFDTAYEKAEQARSLAPDNSQIEALLGQIESKRGRLPEAITHLKKAIELDGKNLKAIYMLAQETERQGAEASEADAQKLLETILTMQPDNLAVLLDLTRLAAKRGDAEALKKAVAKLAEKSATLPDEAKQQIAALQQVAASANPRAAATQSAFLKNVLARVPDYRQSLNAVKTPAEFVGDPFLKFIKLPSPSSAPAAPDLGMTFEAQPIAGLPEGQWSLAGVISLDSESNPSVFVADGREMKIIGGASLSYPGGKNHSGPSSTNILEVDLNYDFKTDLVFAGSGGLRIYMQESPGKFIDATSRTNLPASVINAAYSGVWPLDFDLDGDIDIVLGEFNKTPVVLRNNGNGTFNEIRPFNDVVTLVGLVSADLDGDGDPDVAMFGYDTRLHVYTNERLGQYQIRPVPQSVEGVGSIKTGDINGDGVIDLVCLLRDKTVLRLSDKGGGKDWEVAELLPQIRKIDVGSMDPIYYDCDLLIADLDNNGSLDLIVKGEAFLSDAEGKFRSLNNQLSGIRNFTDADVTGDGKPDLIGLDPQRGFELKGKAVLFANHSAKNYHYQTIRTRAAKSTGDQRINSFGIGGEIEIRSGLLTQKQVITSPLLHFGLGENTQTDVARIVWPNGSVQAEFELKADQSVLAEQRLKGSCPMLFAWDGKQISYVKDTAPWSPALGLHINAQVVAGIAQTEEWFKVPGDRIAPHDGFYDLRVTAELWETYYIDHYSLMVVDHPQGTEVFSDERFAVPPPPLKLYATNTPQPFASAKDDRGQDVSDVVRELDQKYLDTFGKGKYQGITRDHWVELEMPPQSGPQPAQLYLIGHGFLHPTDGSINVAYSQTSYPPPQGLSIEVHDANGNWIVAKAGLGFPAGKLKAVVLDLNNIFCPGTPHKLRLRTNMEIYWDKLEWAEGLPESTFKAQRINLSSAELRYRGFSKFTQANDSSPEIPDYNQLAGTSQKWRDLIGYYTRFGEVRELLEKTDDRMVIMNAGDELRLKFAAQPGPPAGWVRDYVMVGDGWIKDGDLNSTFSKTVLPLPYHGMKDYNTAPRRLEDDPAYKWHPQDWQEYQTRYITPEFFMKALRQ